MHRHGGARALAALALGAAVLAEAGAGYAHPDSVGTGPGQALARRWCAECHDITGAYSELMGIRNYGDPPSFYAVANDLAVTEMAMRAFLRTPHARMTNFTLTEAETAAIVDYILSLRRR